jgi:hypothetical protein
MVSQILRLGDSLSKDCEPGIPEDPPMNSLVPSTGHTPSR